MIEENELKQRRNRRSKLAIERDVIQAVNSLVEELGFSNVTLTGVAERAKIEPAVFYRRYANLDDLFDQYTHKYDYWMGNIAESLPKNSTDEEMFRYIMQSLAQALYKNKGMQKLLIWELSDDNPVTRRTSQLREIINEPLIRLLEYKFKDSGLDINVITSVMISGIYYLILHSKRSLFCDVDYSTKNGKERLQKGIEQLCAIVFAQVQQQNELMQIQNRLLAEGVSEEIILRCFQNKNTIQEN